MWFDSAVGLFRRGTKTEGEPVGDGWLVVGLGNPGAKYEATRHNVGQMALDVLADRIGGRFAAHKTNSRVAEGFLRPGGPKLVLAKSNGYMNTSGGPVSALCKYFGVPAERVIVLHDELDLPLGKIRIKQGGGANGHNGLKDIQARLSVPDFWRLRLGIGHPGDRNEVVNYVLKAPRREEQDLIDRALDRCLQAWPALAAGDFASAQRQLHKKAE